MTGDSNHGADSDADPSRRNALHPHVADVPSALPAISRHSDHRPLPLVPRVVGHLPRGGMAGPERSRSGADSTARVFDRVRAGGTGRGQAVPRVGGWCCEGWQRKSWGREEWIGRQRVGGCGAYEADDYVVGEVSA
jgi:hypothetical protein